MSALNIECGVDDLTVFVVNDSDNTITTALTSSGYSINNIRGSCSTVMKTIEECLPDLVVTCVGKTGKFGTILCREMKNRRQTRAIPVVFVAKEGDLNGANKAFVYGCIDYVQQDDTDLKEKISMYIKMGKMEKSLKRLRDRYDNNCELKEGL